MKQKIRISIFFSGLISVKNILKLFFCRQFGAGIGTMLLILANLWMIFIYKKRLHTLVVPSQPEDRHEKNRRSIEAIAWSVVALVALIPPLFLLMDSQDAEYQPFWHDFTFQATLFFFGICLPLHFCSYTPNFAIFVKNQMFFPPSPLPWTYSNESMELIAHANHLSDQFYLDLLYRENYTTDRNLILKELNRIRKQQKED